MVYITIMSFAGTNLPIHSSCIDFDENCRATYINLEIDITSVPTNNLDTFNEKLTASLKRIVEGGIDMQRMGMVINTAERWVRRHSNCRCLSNEIRAAASQFRI